MAKPSKNDTQVKDQKKTAKRRDVSTESEGSDQHKAPESTYPDDVLKQAVASVGKTISYSAKVRIREAHFELGETVFDEIIRAPAVLQRKDLETQEQFVRFYLEHSSEAPDEFLVYRALRQRLAVQDMQTHLSRYVGKYKSFRPQRKDRATFLTGDIEIYGGLGGVGYFFRHTSKQEISAGRSETFQHEGPIFELAGRIYGLGIGVDGEHGAYFRPMIFRPVDVPAKMPIVGMIMTEHVDTKEPMAFKTVLLRTNLYEEKRFGKHTKAKDAKDEEREKAFNDYISGYLKNNSEANDILYGWIR